MTLLATMTALDIFQTLGALCGIGALPCAIAALHIASRNRRRALRHLRFLPAAGV